MRTAKIGMISVSVILCLLGIVLAVFPEISASAIGMICGVIMVVLGIIKLVGYFSRDLYRLVFQYDLAFGLLLVVLGINMLIHPEGLLNFVSITLGISILADSLFKIQTAMDAKEFGIRKWWLILSVAVLTGILGLVLVFKPSESAVVLTEFLGFTFISEGILNFITVITAFKESKRK